jgi:ABC-type uncharacterized transport system permease subunit
MVRFLYSCAAWFHYHIVGFKVTKDKGRTSGHTDNASLTSLLKETQGLIEEERGLIKQLKEERGLIDQLKVDMKAEGNLRFISLMMAVIAGELLIETSRVIILKGFFFSNYRMIIMAVALLVFIEMYRVLLKYHLELNVPYDDLCMFSDLVIALSFVSFIEFVERSCEPGGSEVLLMNDAFAIGIFFFAALLTRQGLTYLAARKTIEEEAKRLKKKYPKRMYVLRLIFNSLDIGAVLILLLVNTGVLFLSNKDQVLVLSSYAGLILFAFYLVIVHLSGV